MLRAVMMIPLLLAGTLASLEAQSLRGSSASLTRQTRAARQHDLSYLTTAGEVQRFVEMGLLVPVRSNDDFTMDETSFPYARPQVRAFVRRLARQYRAACDRPLVVTSMTRPERRQPRNASRRSVHPTGMAVDLRRTNHMPCRGWLESTLLRLEDERVVEATRERYPPHYHVAVFPEPFERYIAEHGDAGLEPDEDRFYLVRRGDTLGDIADRHDTTIRSLMRLNGLRSSRIYAGQVLRLPEGG